MLHVFHIVLSIDESKCFVCAISFFLYSLTKLPDNNPAAVKITLSSVSLKNYVCCSCISACCGQLQQVAQQKSTCVTRVIKSSAKISSHLKCVATLPREIFSTIFLVWFLYHPACR